MTTYFKAVRPNGASFHDPDFRWLPDGWHTGDPIPDGWTVTHPNYSPTACNAGRYLSVATVATDCTDMQWPCVLLEVEPVGEVRTPHPDDMPHKRAAAAWRVVRELPATDALGPQGAVVAALIERAGQLGVDDYAYHEVWRATRRAAKDGAREAAWVAARDAAWDASGGSAWLAAVALVVRDLISREQYDMLTLPWRTAVGPIHTDDEAVALMTFVPCQHCQGFGEIRHPRWGSYDCPEPTVECPNCDGTGGYSTEIRADHDAEALDDWRRGMA